LTTWREAGAAAYVSVFTRFGMSRNLGVSPARITLSELAMHSMMSAIYCVLMINIYMGRRGGDADRQRCRRVALQR